MFRLSLHHYRSLETIWTTFLCVRVQMNLKLTCSKISERNCLSRAACFFVFVFSDWFILITCGFNSAKVKFSNWPGEKKRTSWPHWLVFKCVISHTVCHMFLSIFSASLCAFADTMFVLAAFWSILLRQAVHDNSVLLSGQLENLTSDELKLLVIKITEKKKSMPLLINSLRSILEKMSSVYLNTNKQK